MYKQNNACVSRDDKNIDLISWRIDTRNKICRHKHLLQNTRNDAFKLIVNALKSFKIKQDL